MISTTLLTEVLNCLNRQFEEILHGTDYSLEDDNLEFLKEQGIDVPPEFREMAEKLIEFSARTAASRMLKCIPLDEIEAGVITGLAQDVSIFIEEPDIFDYKPNFN